MGTSLYDLSVASYLQILGGVAGYLDRGLSYFEENSLDPDEICDARLHPDMLPFRFQILSVAHHSLGAVEGLKSGVFTPPGAMPEGGYRELQKLAAATREGLEKLTAAEVNALAGKDVVFQFRDFKMPYVAEDFILSFSLPNFYFHATTAYDILRSKGAPLGKRDFMGRVRMKT
jgi:hypothetical protein